MTQHIDKTPLLFRLLVTALFAVCIGRGYQCLFWDIPIRSLLWNEDLMTPFVNGILNLSWSNYIVDPKSDSTIQSIVTAIGIAILCLPLLFSFQKSIRWRSIVLWILFAVLAFIASLYHLEKFRTAGQFFEYSLQFMSPVILLFYLRKGISKTWMTMLRISIALTFISHGLYALGFYPVPGKFVAMTISILNCSEDTAKLFLMIVGVLDLVFSIGLFFRGPIFKISVWYCILWGLATSTARILANIEYGDWIPVLHEWGFEMVYRFPHFLIPIVLLIVVKRKDKMLIAKE